jgi:hypothetical protein
MSKVLNISIKFSFEFQNGLEDNIGIASPTTQSCLPSTEYYKIF